MATYTYGAPYSYVSYLSMDNVTATINNTSSFTVTKQAWQIKGQNDMTGSRYWHFGTDRQTAIELYSSNAGFVATFPNQNTNTVANGTTWATLPASTSSAIKTSDIFGTFNATSKTATLTFYAWGLEAYIGGTPVYVGESSTSGRLGTCTVTLNAPPTFTSSQVSFDTDYGTYVSLTTASVSLSNLSAKYGGYITKAELAIGNQVATLTGTASNPLTGGTLSLLLAADGQFVPKVTITDSRGQTATTNLNTITVQPYLINASGLQARRIDPTTSKLDDEGTNAVLQATFSHIHVSGSNLTAPSVYLDGDAVNVTWYSNWTASGGFSGQVSDWSSLGSEVTLYAKITSTMSKETSHTIGLIPRTNLKEGALFETNLPQSFYLIAGRPGGHGLGIGMKPPTDALHIDMDAYFYKNLFAQNMAGMIQMFAGSSVPSGWLLCNGAAVSRTTYARLFAVIGTTYGTGDGSTTFNLPDMRDRMAVGAGSSYAVNAKGGSPYIQAHTHGFTQPKIPNHAHSIAAQATIQTYKATDSSGSGGKDLLWHSSSGTSVKLTLPAHNTNSSGGGGACTGGAVGAVSGATTGSAGNMPPYIGINFIICTGVTS